MDVQAEKVERPEFQMAFADVCQRNVREDDGAAGQDLHRKTDQGEESQGADRRLEIKPSAISARRQRRPAGGLCYARASECSKSRSRFAGSVMKARRVMRATPG